MTTEPTNTQLSPSDLARAKSQIAKWNAAHPYPKYECPYGYRNNDGTVKTTYRKFHSRAEDYQEFYTVLGQKSLALTFSECQKAIKAHEKEARQAAQAVIA